MIFKKRTANIWKSISDLMTGFLFVCIGFLYQLKDTVNKYEKVRNSIHQDFKNVLTEFFPRYVKVLEKYSDDIVEVRIEGNASLKYNGDVNSNAAYFYNMKLSQERAFNVLQYVFSLGAMQEKRQWMIDKLRANGASYSKASAQDAAARCVEVSIHRNAEKGI